MIESQGHDMIEAFGLSSIGSRDTNEDRYLCNVKLRPVENDPTTRRLFAVFDGHGGSAVSQYLMTHFASCVEQHPQFGLHTRECLEQTTGQMESELRQKMPRFAPDGSTMVVALLEYVSRESDIQCTIANLGDSRAAWACARSSSSKSRWFKESMYGPGQALTCDHTASNEAEHAYIYDHGGYVARTSTKGYQHRPRPRWWGQMIQSWTPLTLTRSWTRPLIICRPLRVQPGDLVCSRALGDFDLKSIGVIHAVPDVTQVTLKSGDTCGGILCLASDGLWDVMKTSELGKSFGARHSAQGMCQDLVQLAGTRKSTDNTTVVIVKW